MFYTFYQNNVVGVDVVDRAKGIGEYVIVEADNINAAYAKTELLGMDDDDMEDDKGDKYPNHCECCGWRWENRNGSVVLEGDATELPQVYDVVIPSPIPESMTPTEEAVLMKEDGFVHYKDGRVSHFLI